MLFKIDVYANEQFIGTKYVEAPDEEAAQEQILSDITIDFDIEEV